MTDGEHCTHGGPKCWERECGRYKKNLSNEESQRRKGRAIRLFLAFMGGKYPCILECKAIGYLTI